MQGNGVGANQVTQVRRFADQRLRKPDNSLDPSNRRISLIVQYIEKNSDQEEATPSASREQKSQKARVPLQRRSARRNNPFAALTGKEMTNKMPSGPFINLYPAAAKRAG
jgi:hypothetical protein